MLWVAETVKPALLESHRELRGRGKGSCVWFMCPEGRGRWGGSMWSRERRASIPCSVPLERLKPRTHCGGTRANTTHEGELPGDEEERGKGP